MPNPLFTDKTLEYCFQCGFYIDRSIGYCEATKRYIHGNNHACKLAQSVEAVATARIMRGRHDETTSS